MTQVTSTDSSLAKVSHVTTSALHGTKRTNPLFIFWYFTVFPIYYVYSQKTKLYWVKNCGNSSPTKTTLHPFL